MAILVSSEAFVNRAAKIGRDVTIEPGASVHQHAQIGSESVIGMEAMIGHYSILENNVVVGPRVDVGSAALILSGAQICPNDVRSRSRHARTLGNSVTVGPNVLLHDEVELGDWAIIPSQRTIAAIGNFGTKNRVVTVYGSDDGPRFSIGCQVGVGFGTIKENIETSAFTSPQSAATYVPYIGVFERIGDIVQAAYDEHLPRVDELKALRQTLLGNVAVLTRPPDA